MVTLSIFFILTATTSLYTGPVKRNNAIHFTPLLSKSWKLSFKIKLLTVTRGPYAEILNLYENQQRILDMYYYPALFTKLCYRTKCLITQQTPLSVPEFNTITIQQIQIRNQYRFQVFIKGNKDYDGIIIPRILKNVTFYACHQIYIPANANISQFQVNDNYDGN